HIIHTCQTDRAPKTEPSDAIGTGSLAAHPELRDECPIFAYPLYRGISWASVVDSPVTQWFGSAADEGRMQIIAEALVENWYSLDRHFSSSEEQIDAIQAHFAKAALSWSQPYHHLNQRWTSQWKEEALT
ncbi:MAG: T3SS effector HopA1 family protein, partial [Thermosynechococcaceae cyanobacterium]